MDDYRDLVAAGFAVLCAALMLVAALLFIANKPESGNAPPQIERPGSAPPAVISSNLRNLQL